MGSFLGLDGGAGAAGDAAKAQEKEARRQFQFARESQQQAVEVAQSAASPEQLRSVGESIDVQRRNVAKQERLFDALDPAIMEASKQALGILQGKESKFLQPMRQQREQQRATLLNTLREQLGPGAETSTAGIQALTKFDQETAGGLAQGQQGALGQLFGMGQSGAQGRTGFGQNIGQLGSLGQGAASLQTNAIIGGQQLVSQAGQQVVNSSGSRFAEDAIRGQQQSSDFNSIAGLGAAVTFSDRDLKEHIKRADAPLDKFLDSISPYAYEYKSAEHGTGQFVSVMAQDLEQTELGKSLVIADDSGHKQIDYGKGFGLMLAANIHLHKRLKAIEEKLNG